jgi:hypothetical protein
MIELQPRETVVNPRKEALCLRGISDRKKRDRNWSKVSEVIIGLNGVH